MRTCAVILVLIIAPAACFGAAGSRGPDFFGELSAEAGLQYRTSVDRYSFCFPIYGKVGVMFTTGILESVMSVDYAGEPGLGETYVKGGTESSHIKIGNYTAKWGTGYGYSPVSVLNSRDERYPANVFYLDRYRPNPMFTMAVGSDTIRGEFVVSGRDGVSSSIYDATLGMRLVGRWEGYDMSLGFVRPFGMPPSLFFLTACREEADSSIWSEIGWTHSQYGSDLGSMVIGYKKRLFSASITAEYVLWGANSLILIENKFHTRETLDAGARLFVHFSDMRDAWSTAMNLFIRMEVEKDSYLEPGIVLFFGRPGTFLSPHESENDNSLYLRFRFAF